MLKSEYRLTYPSEWKFEGLGFEVPSGAVRQFKELLINVADGSWDVIETFKKHFGSSGGSTDYGWALTDLGSAMTSESANAATFVDRLWRCIGSAADRGLGVPKESVVNRILADYRVPLQIDGKALRLRELAEGPAPTTSRDPSELQEGVLGGYVLREELGKGGYGVVYRAIRKTPLGDFVFALKKLAPSSFAANPDKALKRFRRELEALRKLEHRAIVRHVDGGISELDGAPFVVMPLVEGTDLRRAARSSSSLAGRLDLFMEVLSALEYAHNNGVLHRDLKPSNILVRSSDLQPVILDFGSAYMLEETHSQTLTTEAVGTVGYVPSEVLANPRTRSVLQDVYACGVMLYEALAGTRPDPAQYRPLQEVEEEYAPLDPLVQRALAPAKKRTASAGKFLEELRSVRGLVEGAAEGSGGYVPRGTTEGGGYSDEEVRYLGGHPWYEFRAHGRLRIEGGSVKFDGVDGDSLVIHGVDMMESYFDPQELDVEQAQLEEGVYIDFHERLTRPTSVVKVRDTEGLQDGGFEVRFAFSNEYRAKLFVKECSKIV